MKLKEDLVTHFQGFQNTFESSDDSTNVVNIPLEPFVVKQDHESFVEKIICGLNKAPDSPYLHTFSPSPFHCFHCKDVIGDGEACQRCTCKTCRSSLCKGLCLICGNNQNSLNDSPSISANSSHNPPHIDERCYECGVALDGIFCQQCTFEESPNVFNPPPQPPIYSCEFYESNARYGHCCTPQVPLIYPEPGYSQDFNSPENFHGFQQHFDQFGDFHPQQDLCCDNCEGLHETSQCQPMNQNFFNSNSLGFDQTQPPQSPVIHLPPQETSIKIWHDQEKRGDRVFKIKAAFGNEQYKPEDVQELFHKLLNDMQNIHEELVEYINTPGWNRPTFYKNGDDDEVDYTIAITPVLSTEEPDNSLSMGDEHLDTIPATESDEVIKSSVEDLVPIPTNDYFEIVINFNDGYSSSDKDSLYENIKYVEASPHNSELVSLEVEKIVIPEDEKIEDDNLREKLLKVNLLIAKIEALRDNPTPSSEFLTKSSSTSPKPFLEGTDTFDNSLPEFENFCFDLEELVVAVPLLSLIFLLRTMKLSLSMTIILKRLVFPPTDRNEFTHEEFADELTHIISPSEYDFLYFRNFPHPGELISILNSGIRENPSSTTCVNLSVKDDHSPLLAYIVWIFLAYLTYPVIPPHLYSFRNEDTIFDPGIIINRFYSFKPGLSHRYGTFKKFNTHRSHLNEYLMEMLFSTLFPMDQ
uniref:Uncharacterized protein n=1 Tax=Tanacetum cinerariifolium TaxID=118510 RepID=A0A6L2JD31_TANCI|nr:hypothetical protein [Tanacetum cinerariifolium]